MCASQVGVPGMAGYGSAHSDSPVKALHDKPVFEPAYYVRRALKLFDVCRTQLATRSNCFTTCMSACAESSRAIL